MPTTRKSVKLTAAAKRLRVLAVFDRAGVGVVLSLDTIARRAFPGERDRALRESKVRNALGGAGRKGLVRDGLAEQVGRGIYILTLKARCA